MRKYWFNYYKPKLLQPLYFIHDNFEREINFKCLSSTIKTLFRNFLALLLIQLNNLIMQVWPYKEEYTNCEIKDNCKLQPVTNYDKFK